MAKDTTPKASKFPERYPRFDLDRSMEVESMRWNTGTIIWYKRLIDATLGVILISFAAVLMAAIFAYRQPLPRLYATAMDGPLYALPYSGSPKTPYFEELKSKLILEQKDLQTLGGGAKKPVIQSPPQGESVKPQLPPGSQQPIVVPVEQGVPPISTPTN